MSGEYRGPEVPVSCYYIARPGDPRAFCQPHPPSKIWMDGLRKEGYRLFRLDFYLPEDEQGWARPEFFTQSPQVTEVLE